MSRLNPEELDFLSENVEIQIVPHFSMKCLDLLSGKIGPFKAGIPINVPLWLAIHYRERNRCKIIPPHWMYRSFLEEKKRQEKESHFFTSIDDHFIPISRILLENCPSDIPDADIVHTLIKDIWDIRSAKLKMSASQFLDTGNEMAKVEHLTMFEATQVRPHLTNALEHAFRIRKTATLAVDYTKKSLAQELSASLQSPS